MKKKCLECNKEFSPINNRTVQKFCSAKCQQKVQRKRNKIKPWYPAYYARKKQKNNEATKRYYRKHREELKLKAAIWRKTHPRSEYKYKNDRFVLYKWNAKNRGLEFLITRDEFDSITNMPCFYCGRKLPVMGIDRVDSSKGYVEGNMVSACKVCNLSKRIMTKEKFFEVCRLICIKHNLLNQEVCFKTQAEKVTPL